MQQECGPGTRKQQGNCFSQPIGRPGNQDDLFGEWSHQFLSIFESLLRRRRSSGDALLFPALTLVQFDQFLDRRRILRILVSLSERDEPRKAQRVARL
jgi:hypothetical protein